MHEASNLWGGGYPENNACLHLLKCIRVNVLHQSVTLLARTYTNLLAKTSLQSA